MLRIFFYIVFIAGLVGNQSAFAENVHSRIKRITVFPFKTSKDHRKVAESQWWDTREKLADSKRFLIASKNFMQAKDVFQARGELNPADAIILGRLLDSDALVTVFLVQRTLSIRVYETKNGNALWSEDLELHPALSTSSQLPDATNKLVQNFLASVPYQGHVIVDSLIGRPVYSEGDKIFFQADVGNGTQINVGDTVQVISIKAEKLIPLFQGGASLEVNVEGVVVKINRNVITVQVSRRKESTEIQAEALVRVPDELTRLKEIYGLQEQSDKNLGVQALVNESRPLTQKQKETKPLVTSLSWIGNLALILLLAF